MSLMDKECGGNAGPDKDGDEFLVDWNSPSNENNDRTPPQQWPRHFKWVSMTVVSVYTLLTGISSSNISPALNQIGRDLDAPQQIVKSIILSVYYIGYIIGALPYGPLSEVFGRVRVLNIATAVYVIFNLGCGFATTKTQLIVLRLISGTGGSAATAIGAGVMADCFDSKEYGKVASFYGLASRLGPALGPAFGGLITEHLGWRWNFHITSIFSGLFVVIGFIVMRESRESVILIGKAKKLKRETGQDEWHTETWPRPEGTPKFVRKSLLRPFEMLIFDPIVQYLSIYQFYITGIQFLILATFYELFENKYGESQAVSSANYVSMALGLVIGNFGCVRAADLIFVHLMKRNAGVEKPEFRVPIMIPGAIFLPIGLLLYGWTAKHQTHWIVPDIGMVFVGIGIIMSTQAIRMYTVDCFKTYAATATGATNLLRACGGFGFPLFAPAMYKTLGYGWTGTMLAGISIVIGLPGILMLWFYGEKMREKGRYAKDDDVGVDASSANQDR